MFVLLYSVVKESYQKCGADMTSRNLTNAVVAIDYTPNFYTMSPPPPPPPPPPPTQPPPPLLLLLLLGPLPLTAFA